jgi:hypothetical protein
LRSILGIIQLGRRSTRNAPGLAAALNIFIAVSARETYSSEDSGAISWPYVIDMMKAAVVL